MPHGNSACVDAVAKAGDDSADDELGDAVRSDLEGGTDREDRATEHDGAAATKPLAHEDGEKRAEETANLVDGDHGALK